MKKLLWIAVLSLVFVGCAKSEDQLAAEGYVLNPLEQGFVFQGELPAPRDLSKTYKPTADSPETACTDEVYSVACSSVNPENLDQYLNRNDVLYIDIRDFKDTTMKRFRNFEVVPYFAYIFNANAHTDENLIQLFGGTPAEPIAVYVESEILLNQFFPKDKTLFIICAAGGRVNQLMNILKAYGYDMSRVYNIGGVGQYTDSKYAPFLADTAEFTIEGEYKILDVNRRN